MITSGQSLLKAASAISAEGGIISDAVVLIDREEGGRKRLAEKNITLHYLLRASEAANALHEIGAITVTELNKILDQIKDD